MNVAISQGFIIGIVAMIIADGFKIQHNKRLDKRGGKDRFMQADIPTNRRQDTKFSLTLKTKPIQNGKGISIMCQAAQECMVNSWSVKEPNGTYETVVRESTPFNRSKYGAQLTKTEGITIYILIVHQLDGRDIHNDYRCDCDTSSGYITDMDDNPTMRNVTKKTQDLSQNNSGFMSLSIGGIVVLIIITIIIYTKTASKNRIINQERSYYSVDCSSNSLLSLSSAEIELMLNKHC